MVVLWLFFFVVVFLATAESWNYLQSMNKKNFMDMSKTNNTAPQQNTSTCETPCTYFSGCIVTHLVALMSSWAESFRAVYGNVRDNRYRYIIYKCVRLHISKIILHIPIAQIHSVESYTKESIELIDQLIAKRFFLWHLIPLMSSYDTIARQRNIKHELVHYMESRLVSTQH